MDALPLTQLAGRVLGTVLDPTIVFSFDRTGFLLHQTQFDPAETNVAIRGRVCLVTGANSGIGFVTARALAQHGARVFLLCRSEDRGRAAVDEIRRESDDGQAFVEVVDMADLASVRTFAKRFAEERVDVLVNNAGVLSDELIFTGDGIELTLATNVIGPFLLTYLLLPKLIASRDARVITVSSGGMYTQRLCVDDLQAHKGEFDGVVQYARTKRAEVVLNEIWPAHAKRKSVSFYCMHPGWADTPAVRTSLPRFYRVMRPLLRTPEQGADTIVWLTMCERIAGESGKFWFDREQRRTHYVPWTRESPEERKALWELCERLCGIDVTGS
jgi:dehydrogenase/reductase SDR family member 12